MRKQRESKERENQSRKSEFWVQKKFKNFSSVFVVSLVWFLVVVACAYFIRGKYILTTTLITNTHFSTRAFSEREIKREREKSA